VYSIGKVITLPEEAFIYFYFHEKPSNNGRSLLQFPRSDFSLVIVPVSVDILVHGLFIGEH
jgi:hypothetical protein